MDLITRYVDGYGWLPLIVFDFKEIYRGEFQPTAQEAFNKCADFAANMHKQ